MKNYYTSKCLCVVKKLFNFRMTFVYKAQIDARILGSRRSFRFFSVFRMKSEGLLMNCLFRSRGYQAYVARLIFQTKFYGEIIEMLYKFKGISKGMQILLIL